MALLLEFDKLVSARKSHLEPRFIIIAYVDRDNYTQVILAGDKIDSLPGRNSRRSALLNFPYGNSLVSLWHRRVSLISR